ncbi:MAG: hypothetical protein L0Y72_18220, partial [Gemmataceae bacterium]|nr:hypothetical protein [Gemmataceae bacterium]
LACIRWFGAHVLFLTFFTNCVLLACFLGMSLGCLAARRARNYLSWTPPLLALAMAAGLGMELWRPLVERLIDVGGQASPDVVFFGTEYHVHELSRFAVPMEVVSGFFFVLIALVFVGLGQELGRAFVRVQRSVESGAQRVEGGARGVEGGAQSAERRRIVAYSVNLLGSVLGIVAFALVSMLELPPFWWFLVVVWGIAYLLILAPVPVGQDSAPVQASGQERNPIPRAGDQPGGQERSPIPRLWQQVALLGCLGLTLFFAGRTSGAFHKNGQSGVHLWSPYYRVDYVRQPDKRIYVNQIVHQGMASLREGFAPAYAYSLPHLLRRESGGEPFRDVLIIGAGAGNDVGRALHFGAHPLAERGGYTVDAVEIDPVILRLGKHDHPDKPYNDPRVRVYIDDGRNFLRQTERQYDLIVYALVDSLVLHSGYSNLRLENYLFTQEALVRARSRLKPGGLLVMYNYFRQGWIIDRLRATLRNAFGEEPVLLTTPPLAELQKDQRFSGLAVLIAGEDAKVRAWLEQNPKFVLGAERIADAAEGARDGVEIGITRLAPLPHGRGSDITSATDDWPFLYLREPMLPDLTVRGMALLLVLAFVLLFAFWPGGQDRNPILRSERGSDVLMFFLGAGFMLVETRAIVQAALVLGSTWLVNAMVLLGILLLMIGANVFYLVLRPTKRWPWIAGLFLSLSAGWFLTIPDDWPRGAFLLGTFAVLVSPIFFSSVLFASYFATSEADRALGWNIAGAVAGGLLENLSLMLGCRNLLLVIALLYATGLSGGRFTTGRLEVTVRRA